MVEIDGAFGAGTTATQEAMLVLSGDGFALDDRLPLVLAQPKTLPARVEATGEVGDFYRTVLGDIDGVRWNPTGPVALRVVREGAVATGPGAAIILPAGRAQIQAPPPPRRLLRAPVVAEHHPLVARLELAGLARHRGRASLPRGPDDLTDSCGRTTTRRSRGFRPGPDRARQLVLDFDWELYERRRRTLLRDRAACAPVRRGDARCPAGFLRGELRHRLRPSRSPRPIALLPAR